MMRLNETWSRVVIYSQNVFLCCSSRSTRFNQQQSDFLAHFLDKSVTIKWHQNKTIQKLCSPLPVYCRALRFPLARAGRRRCGRRTFPSWEQTSSGVQSSPSARSTRTPRQDIRGVQGCQFRSPCDSVGRSNSRWRSQRPRLRLHRRTPWWSMSPGRRELVMARSPERGWWMVNLFFDLWSIL